MSESQPHDHEIHIWPVSDLMQMCKTMEDSYHVDCVTLTQTAKDGYRAAFQIYLMGMTGDAYIKVVRGVEYLIFKGWPGARNYRPAPRYLRTHPIAAAFVVGTKEIVEDSAKGVRVAVIAYVALDVLEEILHDEWSLARLGVKVSSHIAQAALATAIGVTAGVNLTAWAATAGLVTAGVAGAPVVLTFVVVVGLTFVAGWGISWLDSHFHLTDKAVDIMMEYEKELKQRVGENITYARRLADEFTRDVEFALSALRTAREGAAKLREARDRVEKFLRGIPELGDYSPFRLR